MKIVALSVILSTLLLPISAHAIFHCEGKLTRDSFADERAKAQSELQKTIIEYRKVESQGTQTEGVAAQLATIRAKLDKQKKTYQDLDSKYFPPTPVTAFGAACSDMRWVEVAKAKLVEKPEFLGKHWYVWLDKTTRAPKAAVDRPSFDVMAE